MRKVFLSSTEIDIPRERMLAIHELQDIQKGGGPELLNYENFLGQTEEPFTTRAIDSCLSRAFQATEAIVLLRHRAGSPCITEKAKYSKYITQIQNYIISKRPAIYEVLRTASKRIPPIGWVETVIILRDAKQFNLVGGPSPHILALVDPALNNMSDDYRKRFGQTCSIKSLRQLFKTYGSFVQANRMGAGGREVVDEYIYRLIWLCEFFNWLYEPKNNITIKPINNPIDVASQIRNRYQCYSETRASGSIWYTNDRLLDAFAYEFDGEVWIWNNDLDYLANATKFDRLYRRHLPAYEKAIIIVSSKNWEEVKKKKGVLIKKNIESLNVQLRSRIQIGFADIEDDISITIFGINATKTINKLMLLRPMTWRGSLKKTEFYSNLVLGNNDVNRLLIDMLCQKIEEEKSRIEIAPLMQRLEE